MRTIFRSALHMTQAAQAELPEFLHPLDPAVGQLSDPPVLLACCNSASILRFCHPGPQPADGYAP